VQNLTNEVFLPVETAPPGKGMATPVDYIMNPERGYHQGSDSKSLKIQFYKSCS